MHATEPETQTLPELAAAVALELNAARPGERWAVVPPRDGHDHDHRHFIRLALESDPEAALFINSTWSTGRLTIGGDYPRHGSTVYPYAGKPERITVAMGRPPKAVARDIARRFVPQYLAAFSDGKVQRDKARQYEASKQALAADLAAACGTTPHGQEKSHFSAYRSGRPYIAKGEAFGDGSARIELGNVPAELARRIIALVMAE